MRFLHLCAPLQHGPPYVELGEDLPDGPQVYDSVTTWLGGGSNDGNGKKMLARPMAATCMELGVSAPCLMSRCITPLPCMGLLQSCLQLTI